MKCIKICPIQVRRFGLVSLLLFVCNACVIPIPMDSHPAGTRQNITQEIVASIIPGQTNKEEVLLKLGEPDTVSKDGSRFAYYSIKDKALIIVVAPAPGAGGAARLRKQQVFSIVFDSRGVVLEKGVQERPMRLAHPDRPVGYQEDSMVRRIEEYVPSAAKSDLGKIFNGRQINIQDFISSNPGEGVFSCPTGILIITPGDESFARYLRNAFISELDRVNAFSPQGNPSLTAHLDKIGYSISSRPNDLAPGFGGTLESMVKEGYLGLSLTVNSSNGRSLVIGEKYNVPCAPGFKEHGECECLARGFMPAIQLLIENLFRSPEFPGLITPSDPERSK